MPSLNLVQLMGNVTRDPELRYTPKGTPHLTLGLAINRRWKTDDGETKEEVTFVDVEFWRRAAEVIVKYVHKGDPLYVQGRLTQNEYEKDGQKIRKTRVAAEHFEFLGSRKGGANDPAPVPQTERTAQEADWEKDDIPF